MPDSTMLIARLYEPIQPIDRGARYEDPLDEILSASKLGSVTGGGSQLTETGEIEFADIEIVVTNLDDALSTIVQTLERAGAPEGSEIHQGESVIREFGKQQCAAIYLDGVSLPDEVYAELDFDAVVETLSAAAGPESYHGFSQGPEETGLFFYGADAEALWQNLERALRPLPIGQNARVVIRAGKPGLPSRTVRLPRRS